MLGEYFFFFQGDAMYVVSINFLRSMDYHLRLNQFYIVSFIVCDDNYGLCGLFVDNGTSLTTICAFLSDRCELSCEVYQNLCVFFYPRIFRSSFFSWLF